MIAAPYSAATALRMVLSTVMERCALEPEGGLMMASWPCQDTNRPWEYSGAMC